MPQFPHLWDGEDAAPPLRSIRGVHRPSLGTQYFLNPSSTLTGRCCACPSVHPSLHLQKALRAVCSESLSLPPCFCRLSINSAAQLCLCFPIALPVLQSKPMHRPRNPWGLLAALKTNLFPPTLESVSHTSTSGKKLSSIACRSPPRPTMISSHQATLRWFYDTVQTSTLRLGFFPPPVGEGGVIAFVTSDHTPTTHWKWAIILIYKQVGNLFSHALKNHCAIRADCAG